MDIENLVEQRESKENEDKSGLVRKAYDWSSDYVNYKLGSVAGVVGGGIVYMINQDHGFLSAAGAFGKQFMYNVFIAGFNVKTCEKLAKKISSAPASIVASTVVPTAQAFSITYGIHKFGGTPEAFDSTIWQVYVNAPLFLAGGLLYRRNRELNKDL